MRSLLPLAAAGGAGMFFNTLPRWVKIPAVVGLLALAAFELTKDGSEAFNAAAIFGGQGEQGAAQMADSVKVRADMNAGKDVSAAKRTATVTYEQNAAVAQEKQAIASAATQSEWDLKFKKATGHPLTTTETLRLAELKKLKAEAETAEAQSTAARQQAKVDKEAAELGARLVESMQKNDGNILFTFWDIFVPKGALGK